MAARRWRGRQPVHPLGRAHPRQRGARRSRRVRPYARGRELGRGGAPGPQGSGQGAALRGRGARGGGRMSGPPATRRAPGRQRPLRPLRRPLRPRDADGAADRARAGLPRRATRTRASAAGSRELLADLRGPPDAALLRGAAHASTCGGARIYLKREDLCHTGAHKINNVLGQALLAAAHGQAADHRRDRRGPARRGHRHRGRAARPRVRGLHGQRGRRAPGAQRLPHEAARRAR